MLCFTWQSWDSLLKYTEGKTSITEADVPMKIEPLPPFSICSEPPFDAEFMKQELNVTPNLFLFSSTLMNDFNYEFPSDLSSQFGPNKSLHTLFKSSQFSPDVFAVGNDMIYFDRYKDEANNKDIELFDKHHSLWYGRCTSFVLKQNKQAMEILFLGLQFFE